LHLKRETFFGEDVLEVVLKGKIKGQASEALFTFSLLLSSRYCSGDPLRAGERKGSAA
jgi:hypothetical protein